MSLYTEGEKRKPLQQKCKVYYKAMKVELPHDLTNLPKQIGQSVSHRIWELQLQKAEKYDLSLACKGKDDIQENWGKNKPGLMILEQTSHFRF